MKKQKEKVIEGVRIVASTADMPREGGVFILDDPANWQSPVDSTAKIIKLHPSKR
jgi:hypothetical protein